MTHQFVEQDSTVVSQETTAYCYLDLKEKKIQQ